MKRAIVSVLVLLSVLISSCTGNLDTRFTPDGCLLIGKKIEDKGTFYVGTCNDGRYLVEGDIEQPDGSIVVVQGARHKDGLIVISYKTPAGFVEWSPKSGVLIGNVSAAL